MIHSYLIIDKYFKNLKFNLMYKISKNNHKKILLQKNDILIYFYLKELF